jgi:ComF family protein
MARDWRIGLETAISVLKQGLFQVLYPGFCLVCRRPLVREERSFCEECRSALASEPHEVCQRCAATVGPFTALADCCPICKNRSFAFERAFRLGPYQGQLRDAVLQMKHSWGEPVAEAVAELWADRDGRKLCETGATLVVPVPLHWRRKWTRGYNQSESLARTLASKLDLPFRTDVLRRTRNTSSQVQQSALARQENVRGAFAARSRSELNGKAILLVDDVLTTGSTANEAARALRSAGVARVFAAVVALSQK